ncbi:MAG: hypothetical protein IJU27_04265, partial [Bacteroidales bacterium]|nr:hypothetical protein [Bacteroidales bacterium]
GFADIFPVQEDIRLDEAAIPFESDSQAAKSGPILLPPALPKHEGDGNIVQCIHNQSIYG